MTTTGQNCLRTMIEWRVQQSESGVDAAPWSGGGFVLR